MRASSSRASGLMNKKEDRIKEAASLHVKLGQLQRYCELMVELGEVNDLEQFKIKCCIDAEPKHNQMNQSERTANPCSQR